MRNNFFITVAMVALTGFIYAAPGFAQDKDTSKETHSMGQMDKGMPMGKMNMEHMKGMMHDCMGMKKDGKMCDQDMMNKCQTEMSKNECDKMMKQAKAKESTSKK